MDETTTATRDFITTLCETVSHEGLGQTFLDHLADDVIWNATGSSPLSGRYLSKRAYQDEVLGRLKGRLEHVPKPKVDRILVEGRWASILFHTTGAKAKSGLDFSMQYCWLVRVDGDKIAEVVGFFDQKKVTELFAEDGA